MNLIHRFFNQTRKPEGVLGKLMLRGMNSGHAKLADWGMSYLPAQSVSQAVDLGCGAGRNAGELLKRYPAAHVSAIDYSVLSVEAARAYNREMIDAGQSIEVSCQFCDAVYSFVPAELRTILEETE